MNLHEVAALKWSCQALLVERELVDLAYAAVLDTFLSTWLSLLIVTGVLLVLAALLGMLALRAIKRGTPPVPRQAIREAKLTTDALKSDGS